MNLVERALDRLPPAARTAADFSAGVVRGAKDDRVTGLAAEMAFFAALSVVPTLVAAATALTLVPRVRVDGEGADVQTTVVRWIQELFDGEGSAVVDATRDLFERSNSDVFTLSLLVALWAGSRGMDAAIRSIVLVSNDVERRPWWKRRLLSLGLLLATVAVAAVTLSMFVVGPLLGGGRAVADSLGFGDAFVTAWRWLRLALGGSVLTVWALAVLHLARSHGRAWRSDLPGALVTTTLWILVTVGLRVYLATLGRTNPALGALGGPLIALVWFYLLAASLLVGAEVAQQLTPAPDAPTGGTDDELRLRPLARP